MFCFNAFICLKSFLPSNSHYYFLIAYRRIRWRRQGNHKNATEKILFFFLHDKVRFAKKIGKRYVHLLDFYCPSSFGQFLKLRASIYLQRRRELKLWFLSIFLVLFKKLLSAIHEHGEFIMLIEADIMTWRWAGLFVNIWFELEFSIKYFCDILLSCIFSMMVLEFL